MKKSLLILVSLIFSYVSFSQKLEFDYMASSLDEEILKDHQYIKPHFLGNTVARKIKLIDLSYKWEDPPTPMRKTTLIKIEKQPIYFAVRKIITPKFYRNKIKSKSLTKEQAVEQLIEILDTTIMLRYQDTESLESMLRSAIDGDDVVDIFKNKIELIYF